MKHLKLLIFLLFIASPSVINAQNWVKIYDPVIGAQNSISAVKILTVNNKRTLFFRTSGLTGAPFIGCNDTNMFRTYRLNPDINQVYKPLKTFLAPFKCEDNILEYCNYFPVTEFNISNSDQNFALKYQQSSFSNCSGSFHRFQITTDGGTSFTGFFGDTARANSIKISPENDNNIFVSINDYLFKSTNRGQNWNSVPNSPTNIKEIIFNTFDPNYIYLTSTASNTTLHISSDGGNTFGTTAVSFNSNSALFFRSVDTVYTYSGQAVLRSVNKGLNWNNLFSFPLANITSFELHPALKNVIYAGYANQGVWVSTNNGSTFSTYINNLTPNNTVIGIFKDRPNKDSLYVVTDKGMYLVKDIYSGIKQISSNIPERFELSQNYPNPFNPETNIIYKINKAGLNTLNVYDITGKKIAELLNEYQAAGTYLIAFNGKNLSSGIYYYKLESGSQSEIKKMVLTK